jgi:hypothetical protein
MNHVIIMSGRTIHAAAGPHSAAYTSQAEPAVVVMVWSWCTQSKFKPKTVQHSVTMMCGQLHPHHMQHAWGMLSAAVV